MDTSPGPLSLLTHPYQELLPVGAGHDALRTAGRKPGSALIWSMGFSPGAGANPRVEARPGGLPVIAVLPRVAEITSDPDIIHVIQRWWEMVPPAGFEPATPALRMRKMN